MQQTGIIRKIDDLGRIAIPKELRRAMRLVGGDELEILSYDDQIVLRRPQSEDYITQLEGVQERMTADNLTEAAGALQQAIDLIKEQFNSWR